MKISRLPTYEEWRKNETLASEAARVVSDEHFQMMLAILQHNSRLIVLPFGSPETDVVRGSGYRQGYDQALADLLSFTEYIPEPVALEETFEDEHKEQHLWQPQT